MITCFSSSLLIVVGDVVFICVFVYFADNRPEGKVLETVGVFEAPKQHGKYETGQVQ